jgi:hypothetical protein
VSAESEEAGHLKCLQSCRKECEQKVPTPKESERLEKSSGRVEPSNLLKDCAGGFTPRNPQEEEVTVKISRRNFVNPRQPSDEAGVTPGLSLSEQRRSPRGGIGILESSGFQRVRIGDLESPEILKEILAIDLGRTRVRKPGRHRGSTHREFWKQRNHNL